jgi:hypothetical protein
MKLFKDANNDIFAYELDGSQDDLIGDKTLITQAEADAIRTQKQQAALGDMSYQEKRRLAYPSFGDQMDMLFHGGYDYWKQQIQIVKDKYPKG